MTEMFFVVLLSYVLRNGCHLKGSGNSYGGKHTSNTRDNCLPPGIRADATVIVDMKQKSILVIVASGCSQNETHIFLINFKGTTF